MISRMPWTIRLISNQHWCEWKVEVQVKKTNFHVSLSHQRSVTVSVETRNLFKWKWCLTNTEIIYNYPRKGRWIVVDIYQDVKRRGIYQLLFTDPEGDSCFSIYQIRWIKKNSSSISSSETFEKWCTTFLSVRKTVNIQGYSELQEPIKARKNCYPLIWKILLL